MKCFTNKVVSPRFRKRGFLTMRHHAPRFESKSLLLLLIIAEAAAAESMRRKVKNSAIPGT